ncbi:MAG: glutathione peroxidase, partial [Tabrizicola sp.]|nr:glutathione peroxidase [Tabrizicola sp.]
MGRLLLAMILLAIPSAALAGFRFQSIDGGVIDLDDWRGQPMLIVNTASLCGYTGQYDGLQALHERYGPQGLLVLAVPSDDFAQELADEAEVKEFCAVNFDLTLPMAEITPVSGSGAHPFYAWVKTETGFVPRWNFNKVLIGRDGAVAATWGAATTPESRDGP